MIAGIFSLYHIPLHPAPWGLRIYFIKFRRKKTIRGNTAKYERNLPICSLIVGNNIIFKKRGRGKYTYIPVKNRFPIIFFLGLGKTYSIRAARFRPTALQGRCCVPPPTGKIIQTCWHTTIATGIMSDLDEQQRLNLIY